MDQQQNCTAIDTIPPFAFGVRLGIAFAVEAGFLSALAVTALLSTIGFKTIQSILHRNHDQARVQEWRFFRSSMDYLFILLLFYDLVQSMGYVTMIKWVKDAQVTPGPLCTAQGILQHVGEIGVAFTTLAIAVHTFRLLMFPGKTVGTNRPWLMPSIIFGLITLFQVLMTTLPALVVHDDPSSPFYGEAGYWCWIRAPYFGERLGLEYAIFWFIAIVSILLYTPLFFLLRGNLTIERKLDPGKWVKFAVHWRAIGTGPRWAYRTEDQFAKLAKTMLAYPIVYIFLILPISLNRWIAFNNDCALQRDWPSEVSITVCVTFALSGLVNVLLYITTRPALLPFRSWLRCCGKIGFVHDEDEEKRLNRERPRVARHGPCKEAGHGEAHHQERVQGHDGQTT
ncbi:hypothetical protein FRC02_009299 [Tulasnella sp. 418]|nr:hypothetical protein FRC02_009299 [Tulasnella sp. 418]